MSTLANIEAQLSQLIAQQETAGGTAGVGASQNNPGGMMYAPWEAAYGATSGGSGFATFPSLQAGFSALNDLIDRYVQGGASITSMMNAYAPPAANPTTPARIQALAAATGLNPNSAISAQVTAPAASTGAPATATTPATSVGQSALQGLLQGLLGPFGGAVSGGVPQPGSSSSSSTFSWARITTGIVGVLLLIVGLMQLKTSQVVIQNVTKTGKRIGETIAAAS